MKPENWSEFESVTVTEQEEEENNKYDSQSRCMIHAVQGDNMLCYEGHISHSKMKL